MELKHYFLLLRHALGFSTLTKNDEQWLKQTDWTKVLQFAQKQALVGVMFEGIQQLPKHLAPKGPVLLMWIAQAQAVERRSRKLNAATAAVYRRIAEMGADCCILKGQGNALLYPNPLSRTPGDVDVWLVPKTEIRKDGTIKRLDNEKAHRKALRHVAAALTSGRGAIGHESLNHIEMTVDGIPVELHPTPAILNSPLHDRRLQHWLLQQSKAQCANRVELPDGGGQIAIPTREFNLVYQLQHLYHHHLFEGIGLRQFVDYALLLAPSGSHSGAENAQEKLPHEEKLPPMGSIEGGFKTLKKQDIYKFAGAVMYVLQEVFGLAESQFIVPVDQKRGQLLLADILQGGNFGYYDDTFAKNAWGHNLQRICRDIRLMRYYPAETLAEPFFRLWHWVWRKRQKA